jgi:hypothetical protein
MADAKPTNVTKRSPREIPVAKPRWAFFKGFLMGAAIEVPLLATTVWLLARLGIGDPDVSFMRFMRLTTVFCGIAALFTAGGIGRLAAQGTVDGGRKRAVFVAMRAHAAAGVGLLIIAAVPHGHLPVTPWEWVLLASAGLVPGAVCGVIIGFVCGGVTPVGLADVWSLAQRPSEALRQLLDPRDLVKLGAALRTRTTHLFEGIFDPAPLPPKPTTERQTGDPENGAAKPAEPPSEPVREVKPDTASKPSGE